ncbi:hypothetical protein QBC40DRAFT_289998 [Triangularia verruculosa]|uniref:DUF3752 domain-containing protein n=1 Tax=Triangularia verruculosa TaxID=2587418 RepID=A0AAN6X8C9_9PEZI|nr:hypothetical protein QBC40DRAFT_289998 [Triangularia verruculosa]
MSSIGPQLPPHLQKRKRTPEDDDQPGSPPPKVSRRDNDDEIPLDDDSDAGFGPSAPSIGPSMGPPIGPSLPPASTTNSKSAEPTVAKPSIGPSRPPVGPARPPSNDDEIPLDDSDSDSDDATGPSLPTVSKPPSPPRRVIGPAPPPAPLSERPTANPDSSDSDSDDDYGPALPGSVPSRPISHGPSLPAQYAEPEVLQRDSWMIAPPTDTSYRAPDPTKLKARKFNTGPRATTESKSSSGVSSIWTETPEEKRRRLANAVLGRDDPSNNNNPQQHIGPSIGPSKRTADDEAKIKAYTEQTRGKSLVEQHQARKAEKKAKGTGKGEEEEEDDPSKRAFSWEKDMKVGGVVSGKQKRELLNKAANFGGRFQKGNYL